MISSNQRPRVALFNQTTYQLPFRHEIYNNWTADAQVMYVTLIDSSYILCGIQGAPLK